MNNNYETGDVFTDALRVDRKIEKQKSEQKFGIETEPNTSVEKKENTKPTKHKIVFMGTPEFSVPALEKLYEKYDVIAVYTREPKPVGRKMILTKTPVHIFAEEHNIPVYTPKNFKDILDITKLQMLHPDIIISCAYGVILPERVINIPKLACINIHASLLPKYRGANPIQRAIINGDSITGITIMNMDKGVDTGDMLLKDAMPISKGITYGELEKELSIMGSNLVIKYLENMENILPQRQPKEFTLAPKLEKEEAKINWENNATKIHNLVRALSPAPYANFTHNDNIIKLIKSEVVSDKTTDKPVGTILSKDLEIACGEGSVLKILSVQKIGGKILSVKDFLNGYKIEIGEVLK